MIARRGLFFSSFVAACFVGVTFVGACKKRDDAAKSSALTQAMRDADVMLPESTFKAAPVDSPAIVLLEKTRVRVFGDPYPVASIPNDPALGFSIDDKANARTDLYVTPLGAALTGAHEAAKDAGAAIDAIPNVESRLVVVADAQTSYRLFVEVLFSAGAAEFSEFFLAVRSGTEVGTLPIGSSHRTRSSAQSLLAKQPSIFARSPRKILPREVGPFHVMLVAGGIDIAFGDSHVAPGCNDPGAGLTLPRAASGDFDFAGLTACAKKIHEAVLDGGSDFTFGGDAEISVASMVRAIDAVRGDAKGHYFDEVVLTLPGAHFP